MFCFLAGGRKSLSHSIYGICVSNLGSGLYGLPSRHSRSWGVRHAASDCCPHQVPALASRGVSAAHVGYISPAVYFQYLGRQGDLLQEKPAHAVEKCCTAVEKDSRVAGIYGDDDVDFAEDSSGDYRVLLALLVHSNHRTLGTSR